MLEFGFYTLSLLMAVSFPWMIFRFSMAERQVKLSVIRTYSIAVLLWVVYLLVVSRMGWLDDFGLPPRIPLFLFIPLMLLMLWFLSKKLTKQALQSVPEASAVIIQSFRIVVEILIYYGFIKGIYPEAVTFEGTNFDIAVGLTAPLFGIAYVRRWVSARVMIIWNIAGLAILGTTIATFIVSYYFGEVDMSPDEMSRFVQMPYLLLPGILAPIAILYHIISIMQFRRKLSVQGE